MHSCWSSPYEISCSCQSVSSTVSIQKYFASYTSKSLSDTLSRVLSLLRHHSKTPNNLSTATRALCTVSKCAICGSGQSGFCSFPKFSVAVLFYQIIPSLVLLAITFRFNLRSPFYVRLAVPKFHLQFGTAICKPQFLPQVATSDSYREDSLVLLDKVLTLRSYTMRSLILNLLLFFYKRSFA